MALQGTIDAFPLTDVLALLSSSSKSGRLSLEGDRGRAALWIEQGSVTGGTSQVDHPSARDLVFALLRFGDGAFVFDGADEPPPFAVDPTPLEECIAAAVTMLDEWRSIEAVIPSMQHRVRLAPELSVDAVSVTAEQWRLLAACSGSPTVAEVALATGLDEFGCCAALSSLVNQDLLLVSQPVPTVDAAPAPLLDAPQPVEDFASPHPDGGFPDHFPIDDLLGTSEPAPESWVADEPSPQRFAAAQTFEPLGSGAFSQESFSEPEPDVHDRTAEAWDDVVAAQEQDADPWPAPVDDTSIPSPDDTADEVLRQMSRLSPKAAEAIAAALNGPTPTPSSEPVGPDDRPDEGPVTFMGSF